LSQTDSWVGWTSSRALLENHHSVEKHDYIGRRGGNGKTMGERTPVVVSISRVMVTVLVLLTDDRLHGRSFCFRLLRENHKYLDCSWVGQ
jgi:hypothetical protein